MSTTPGESQGTEEPDYAAMRRLVAGISFKIYHAMQGRKVLMPEEGRILRQACEWDVITREREDFTQADKRRFIDWLSEDPRHLRAFASVGEMFEKVRHYFEIEKEAIARNSSDQGATFSAAEFRSRSGGAKAESGLRRSSKSTEAARAQFSRDSDMER